MSPRGFILRFIISRWGYPINVLKQSRPAILCVNDAHSIETVRISSAHTSLPALNRGDVEPDELIHKPVVKSIEHSDPPKMRKGEDFSPPRPRSKLP